MMLQQQQHNFYKDFLYKKLKPKSDVLENLLETNEQNLQKSNEIHSIYNVSLPTQDEVWICGRIYSENSDGGGKLNEHNVMLQGSYVCSNSQSISLNLSNCPEYSLFPGQMVLAKGRNPDGKRFLCKEIVEPSFVSNTNGMNANIREKSIHIKLEENEDLTMLVASGPYMTHGGLLTTNLNLLVDIAKAKNIHALMLLGPFLDCNHDILSGGNIQYSFEELLQKILDELALEVKDTQIQVIIQPSLRDLTQEPIYPVQPFNCLSPQFLKKNECFHFVQEPNMIRINDTLIAVTTTDIIKDLAISTVSRTSSSDKISRNLAHILRQRSFYPIYPPPDHVCIDYESWEKYSKIEAHPKIFITVSDLATFNKEVNNCVCLNPGRLVKGSSTGTYAKIIIGKPGTTIKPLQSSLNTTTLAAVASNSNTSIPSELAEMYAVDPTTTQKTQTQSNTNNITPPTPTSNILVTFHKI